MSGLKIDRVQRALCEPESMLTLKLPEWETLVRQARSADLMARLAATLHAKGLLNQVSPAPRAHFLSAQITTVAQTATVTREVTHIKKALAGTGVDIILLKGAAYVLSQSPAAHGRLFSDIDILVPKASLDAVEAALMLHGWASTHQNAYDQRYYRQWMHELPPLQHIKRDTMLDVHHTILPETARLKPDAAKLIAASRPVPGHPNVRVLAPVDMVLHSATHLFHNEEMSHGLRDLSDLDLLLRHHGAEPDFWGALMDRAAEIDLTQPLYNSLRYTHKILGTPLPPAVLAATEARANWRTPLMDALWLRALRTHHATCSDAFSNAALGLLYLRAHWLRMPPWLLAYHLSVKALRREENPAA
ncbi:nucleotidyltransferase family protein [Rhodoferax sp.]|uniref:nucleotidyltransferase domain-containing protein n=1 Tax=Rhodoferax sp. TaxID=50421 RepID=UPI00374D9DDB